MKSLDVCQGLRLVATDLLHRHYLVYDAAFKKIGSIDCRMGVWTFTCAQTSESYFGYSRDGAVQNWLKVSGFVPSVQHSPPGAFLGLKTAL